MSSAPNPIFSLVWFFITTLIFFIIRYITLDSAKNIYFIIYIFILMLGEFFINLRLTSALCGGAAQTGKALMVTFVPWLIIFGLLNVMLVVFKGWKTPFSNTFGYLATRIMGVNGVLNAVLTPRTSGESEVNKSLEKIYEDKSIFINQLYLDDYGTVWNKYVQEGVFVNQDILKNSLYKMVFLKDLVSEFVWFSLTGCLVTSVAYNYIVNSGCSKSAKDIRKHHDEIKKQKISEHEQKQAAPKPRIYKVKD